MANLEIELHVSLSQTVQGGRSPRKESGQRRRSLLETGVGFLWISIMIMLLGIRKARNDERLSCLFIFAASPRVLKFADAQNVDAYVRT